MAWPTPFNQAHGSAGMVLAASWSHATDVSAVDFPNLGGYRDLVVVGKQLTLAASGIRFFFVSTDNLDTIVSGTGLYTYVDVNGGEIDLSFGTPHFTASASARSFAFSITPFGVSGGRKRIAGTVPGILDTTAALNAIRFSAIEGDYSTPTTFTGGSIAIWGTR